MYKYIEKGDKLIIISGATATGKTGTAIDLAKKIDGEIISCDSMQVYKYMDIGTAKPTIDEMSGIPHHLIDVLEPDEDFSIAIFKDLVFNAIEDIKSRGKTPILCGGTGFYTNAIMYNTDFTLMEKDDKLREHLYNLAKEKGNDHLYKILEKKDIESAKVLHQNNVKKVVRAIEFFETTGTKISIHNKIERKRELYFDVYQFVLDFDREKLYHRIDMRVDIMMKDGLIQEVKSLVDKGYHKNLVSMQGIGYNEFFDYFEGKATLEETVDLIKKNSRNYAKRQLTWFRNKSLESSVWLNNDVYNKETLINKILGELDRRD
ncbi:MAG: tRNA (adenosine(37)-N6)-dimethylallyltransferase MiaA [Lachnospirales bacterium]